MKNHLMRGKNQQHEKKNEGKKMADEGRKQLRRNDRIILINILFINSASLLLLQNYLIKERAANYL